MYIAHFAALAAIVLGSVALMGWQPDLELLLLRGLPPERGMSSPVALAFALAGAALLLESSGRGWPGGRRPAYAWAARACALVVLLIGFVALREYVLLNPALPPDAAQPDGAAALGSYQAWMTPACAFNFIVLGLTLVLLGLEPRRGYMPAQSFAWVVVMVGLLALLGYLYGVPARTYFHAKILMTPLSGFLFVALGLGALFARPNRGMMAVLTGPQRGSLFARKLLPAVMILPFVTGWLCLMGQRLGLYGVEVGLALYTITNIVIFVAILGLAGYSMNQLYRERSQAEESLRISEGRLAGIIDAALDAVITLDHQQRIVLFNKAAVAMLRCPEHEALGQPVTRFIPERFHAACTQGIRQYGERGIAPADMLEQEAFRWRRADGEEFPVETSLSKVGAGNDLLFTVILRDVTERRRAEQRERQSQKMEALGTLAGGVAHDFNNILGIISGNAAHALAELPAAHPLREGQVEISKAADRAADLVRQILDFSRQREPRRVVMQAGPVIDDALRLLRATVPALIEFRTRYASDLPNVLADPTQIRQIIMNLGTNAAHAMREKGGALEVRLDTLTVDAPFLAVHPGLREGPYLRISVSDTGCGMDEAVLARLFEPFFTTKGVGEGTGLGLAAVHGIVQSHQGVITAYSEPGRGSRFHIYLPAVEATVAAARPPRSELTRGQAERVMVVDDEKPLLSVAIQYLKRLGYAPTGYTDVASALAAFRARPNDYDLIMTDRMMPVMSGDDLARELLKIRPDIPIVMASGFLDSDDEKAARAGGIVETLMKPYSADELAQVLDRALSERRRPGTAAGHG